MFKNKQIYIFISLICASTLSLYSMEQVPGTTIPDLQNFLNIQKRTLHQYKDSINVQNPYQLNLFQNQIVRAQKRLNQNPSLSELYKIREYIDNISVKLNITVEQIKQKEVDTQDDDIQDRIRTTTKTPSQTQPIIPTAQQTIIPQSHTTTSSSQSKQSQKSKFSSTQPKRSSIPTQSQFNALKRFLTYFNGAAICAGIGLYSYYKLPEQLQWYRPVFIGLSAFGGTACSILAYKNLKFFISKYDTM